MSPLMPIRVSLSLQLSWLYDGRLFLCWRWSLELYTLTYRSVSIAGVETWRNVIDQSDHFICVDSEDFFSVENPFADVVARPFRHDRRMTCTTTTNRTLEPQWLRRCLSIEALHP